MTNLEVATCLVGNAIAYGKDKGISPQHRVDILMSNLRHIDELLKKPTDTNKEYTWDDFK